MANGLLVRDLSLACQTEQGLRVLLSSINMTIAPGACMALVGESGSGKSLTAKAILQLLPPNIWMSSASHIALDGQIITEKNEREMCQIRGDSIALVSQDAMSAFNPVRQMGSQLLEACPRSIRQASQAEQRDFIQHLFDQVGLRSPDQLFHQYPHQLSGGMRQRALIAMAMASSPKLLIADEPTTALDIVHQRKIMTLLRSLSEEGRCALLLITHDLRMAASYADTMMVMQSGQCLEQGNTQALIRAPQTDYTRQLLRSVNRSSSPPSKPPSSPIRLSVDGLSASYARDYALVLDSVSFDLHAGETVAIIGASGSGKSTLAKVLIGLMPASAGQCHYGDGVNSASLQMIFQDPLAAVDPRWLVMDILMEAFECCAKLKRSSITGPRAAMRDVLEQVALPESILSRYPHACSGGELQRICIARALLMQPSVLICDEPTSALDASIQKQTMALLQRIQASHALSLLYITHDIESLRGFAHRGFVMSEGKVVESGPMTSILDSPQTPETRRLLEASWPEINLTD